MITSAPSEIRAKIAPEALSKTTRFFNATLHDILNELLQNARRAGATHVIVTEHGIRITVEDDGAGIADPSKLLEFGASGWDAKTAMLEDAAGMGFFALSRRGCAVYSHAHGQRRGWIADITREAFEGRCAAKISPSDLNTNGTSVSFDRDDRIDNGVQYVLDRVGEFYPVRLRYRRHVEGPDGPYEWREIRQRGFLDECVAVSEWSVGDVGVQSAIIGVSTRKIYSREAAVNFHGLTIPAPTPTLSQLFGGLTVQAMVDLKSAEGVELVLPARKEIVDSPVWRSLNEACLDALYAWIADQATHTLSHSDYEAGLARGHRLNEAAPLLTPWRANDANYSVYYPQPDSQVGDDCLIVDFDGEAIDEQCFARAIAGADLEGKLFAAEMAYRGYSWYDAIGRISKIEWIFKIGGELLFFDLLRGDEVSDDGVIYRAFTEEDAEKWRAPDEIILRLTIERNGCTATRHIKTDAVIMGEGYSPEYINVYLSAAARAERNIAPDDLADLMVKSCFAHSDDADADSWETQERNFKIAAYAHACSILIDKQAGDLAFIREHAEHALAWTCPSDRRVVVAIEGHDVTAEFRERALEDAAGDLLDALKQALPILEIHRPKTSNSDDVSDRLAYDAALAAIAKATPARGAGEGAS